MASLSDPESPYILQYPASSPLQYPPPPYLSSPSTASSADLSLSPPFTPGDYPPCHRFGVGSEKTSPSHEAAPPRLSIAHPYARLYAKKEGAKRRKIWNHALEKSLFNPHELSTMGAPHRRTIYMASLEAHVDRLHALMADIGYFPIDRNKLEPFKGLNSKTAKSMVAGLQHDSSYTKLKLLELERSNEYLRKTLARPELLITNGIRHGTFESPKPVSYNHNYHQSY